MSDIQKEAIEAPPGQEAAVRPLTVVGIGASAGGLEALGAFFSHMPADSGLAFVVVQHLAPDYKSLMVELLARITAMPVHRAEEGMPVRANQVFLIPPRFNLVIKKGRLHLEAPPPGKVLNLPIDRFFHSLAQECGEQAVAIILSGTGSDGARGIRAVKEAGGMIMVQAEASAKFAGMPSSAIATGTADFVLPVEEMPEQLLNFVHHPFAIRPREETPRIPEDATEVEKICARVREVTGIDFQHYKPATLLRRIERRMNITQLQEIEEYLRFLNQSRPETENLAKDLLIGVTKFFRDTEAFVALRGELRQYVRRHPERSALRAWSAACSTGEEAYSVGMLLEEMSREEESTFDFKIFATDVDRAALDMAGAGLYPASLVADVPPEFRDRSFVREGNDHFRITKKLRDHLIFARQDLLSNPPFTKLDLIVCRNLLIYLRPPSQRQLLALFHFALRPGGLLFLGSSESVGDLAYAFATIDSKQRIFRKLPGVGLRNADSPLWLGDELLWTATAEPERRKEARRSGTLNSLSEIVQRYLLKKFAPATLVCNMQFQLIYSVGAVDPYLRLPGGPARLDLLKMVPRELALALHTASAQCLREGHPVNYGMLRFHDEKGGEVAVRLEMETFDGGAEEGQLFLVVLHPEERESLKLDSGTDFNYDEKLLERVGELEKELQITRENLQASIEQQETANEELQAANEELLAANEELQSTNEELESVNEELYTVNAEYQNKINELTVLNDDMNNFIRTTNIGTVFLDEEFRLRRFTPAFANLAGLVETDQGRFIGAFSHPVLVRVLEMCRAARQKPGLSEEVVSLPGYGQFLLRLQPYAQAQSGLRGYVTSLIDVSRVVDAERELEAILQTVSVGICVTDEKGNFVEVNRSYCQIYGYEASELIGRHFTLVVPPENQKEAKRLHDRFISAGEEIPGEWEVIDKLGRRHRVEVRASLLHKGDFEKRKITVVTDLTGPMEPGPGEDG